ncbi:hypothetical protein C8N25_11458 [Algoriphagus antarcticus]|uniref:PIN domain-containing protein n=2 Tax=Algoriphagus antarcticus TaxID=238540 RepID=A0A3E0DPC8_9BACT|nr:hypothetical protein [Algoriphagus antarcticus]REG84709.1 hypothetical protein C8N25_11458 [Algoriphagus antarcticus]
MANTNYQLLKQLGSSEAKNVLRNFRLLAEVLPLNEKIVDLSINDEKMTDFEDGLQLYSALEFGYDIIITRNQKDFKSATIPVMSPSEYITGRKK